MRKRILILSLLVVIIWAKVSMIAGSARQTLKIDNEFFHSYGEKQGRWIVPKEMPQSIEALFKELEVDTDEFRSINGLQPNEAIPATRPLFFPYGDKYTKLLLTQGKGREIVQSDYRELVWPVGSSNSKISSKLGFRRNVMHSGVDIACPHKSPIVAAAEGTVVGARYQGNYGLSVTIQHNINQIQTLYAHNSILLVKEGDKVAKGQIIAFSGSTGHSTGPHLHFEVRYQNIILNPEHYFPAPVDPDKIVVTKEEDI